MTNDRRRAPPQRRPNTRPKRWAIYAASIIAAAQAAFVSFVVCHMFPDLIKAVDPITLVQPATSVAGTTFVATFALGFLSLS